MQLSLPVFGLLVIMLMREGVLANSQFLANTVIQLPIPFFYNIPLKPFASFGIFFNVTECDEWYMYQFNEDVPEADRNYFGHNEGRTMKRENNSTGMLTGGLNILETPCPEVGRTVPYFKELSLADGRVN